MLISKVEVSGINTSNLKVLNEKEKSELLKRVHSGDKTAREELISGNLRLVLSVIQKFTRRCDNADDLFQVGCVGLIKAVDNFDINQNVKFSTYAVPMIIGELRRYIRDNNMIRVSRSVRDLAYKALAVREKLTASLARDPTVDEICTALNKHQEEISKEEGIPLQVFGVKEVSSALDAVVDPISLYDPVYTEGGDSIYLIDQIYDHKTGEEGWVENLALLDAIKKLTPRDKTILYMRYYRGKTQMEVADEIGISQAQVSRLEKNTLMQIRKQM